MALSTEFLPYIFGANTGETQESIARKRAVAEALLARGGTPKNVGEGLTAVGNALASVILERRAAAAEKQGQAGAGDIFSEFEKTLLPDNAGGGTPSAAPGVAPPIPAWSPRNPPPATENVPAGWSAGGSFAPPANGPAAQPTNLAGGADPTQFIAGLEGFSPKATWDVRQHSIGYGTRATPQEVAGQPITREDAQRRLGIETAKAANYVDSVIKIPLTPNQKTALTSLAYNVGSFGQGLINAINSGDAAGVGSWMAKYGVSDPRYAKGVGARRQKEIDLWNAGGGAPTQVASLDPSIGLPPAPTAVQSVAGALPGGGPPAPSPGVATVASALQGGGGAPAGPEMASAAPFPMGGASGREPPFVPPSVPTGIQSGRPTPMMPTQALSPSAPPPRPAGAPPPAMGGGISEAARQKALEVLNHPFSNAVQKAQALEVLKMAQQQRDPAYQLEQKMKQAQYDALINPKPKEPDPFTLNPGDVRYGGTGSEIARNPLAPVREFTPEEKTRFGGAGYFDEKGAPHLVGGGGTTVNLNQPPTPEKGFRNVYDNEGRLIAQEIIPGGPADLEAQAAAKRAGVAAQQQQQAADIVTENLGKAIGMVEANPKGTAGGFGSLAQNLSGTQAFDVKELLKPVRANIGFDRLQQMREASKTGGALGSVSTFETENLQSVLGSLEQGQNPDLLLFNLRRLQRIYAAVTGNDPASTQIAAIGKAVDAGVLTKEEGAAKMDALIGGGASPAAKGNGVSIKGETIPPGWLTDRPDRREIWDFMTPEAKARARAAVGGQ